MSQSMRKIVSIVMPVAVAATMGCHADGITKPQTAASPEAHGLIVSSPMLLSLASTSAGAATASQGSLAFVSLIPGTAPGGVDPTNCATGDRPFIAFDDWKQANGFLDSANPSAHAFYGNLGDLRVGRDMNCVRNGQNIACYVTNYLAPFNGGTYVFVTVPATTSGGSATHSIVAVDNNGNTLWTVTL